MESFRIIALPAFRAARSEADPNCDFDSPYGILRRFNAYFSAIKPAPRDSFMPRDFLYFDEDEKGFVWMWALTKGMCDGGYDKIDFEGGLYLTYAYKDGDDAAHSRLYSSALKYIKESEHFCLDSRSGRYAMGHIITPQEVIDAQGWAQMETFIPIRLKV
ncbi:MAG: hypothetical protein ACOX8S_02865 [Christensenellales bacterium]